MISEGEREDANTLDRHGILYSHFFGGQTYIFTQLLVSLKQFSRFGLAMYIHVYVHVQKAKLREKYFRNQQKFTNSHEKNGYAICGYIMSLSYTYINIDMEDNTYLLYVVTAVIASPPSWTVSSGQLLLFSACQSRSERGT